MKWSALTKWIVARGFTSGTVLGGLLGGLATLMFRSLVGAVIGGGIGFVLGGAVGAATGITLTRILRHLLLSYPNLRVSRYIVTPLFVLLNMFFTIVIFGFPLQVAGATSLLDLISSMFQAGIVPALFSAIAAVHYAPAVVDQVTEMQADINMLRPEAQSQ